MPNSQPPLPSDWEVHPTYTIHHNVPYYLAHLWDSQYQRIVEERTSFNYPHKGKLSQDLKITLKRAKGTRPLLHDLECEIRNFIQKSRDQYVSAHNNVCALMDSEDEDIVLIGCDSEGRVITMSEQAETATEQRLWKEKLTFESSLSLRGSFIRWLIHELAEYYGLESRSEGRERRSSSGNVIQGRDITIGFPAGGGCARFNTLQAGDPAYIMPQPLCGLV